MTEDAPAILAERLIERHPNRVYPQGRICTVTRCYTVLSIYNAGTRCAVHEGKPTSLRRS